MSCTLDRRLAEVYRAASEKAADQQPFRGRVPFRLEPCTAKGGS